MSRINQRVLRTVRLLPQAVKIGLPDEPEEPEEISEESEESDNSENSENSENSDTIDVEGVPMTIEKPADTQLDLF